MNFSYHYLDNLLGIALLQRIISFVKFNLENENTKKTMYDVKYSLLTGKVYTVGRKDCDIVVEGDAAISRKHAEIVLDHPEANLNRPDKLPTVNLTDLSKFGTSVNNEKLEKNKGVELKDGDVLLLGTKSNFTVVYEPFIITSSCLDNQSKNTVRSLIGLLGGHVINDWKKDCSLLLMQSLSVTIKVICALVCQKYIVSPAYLQAYTDHLQGKGDMPNPKRFQPEVTETQIDPSKVTFGPNKRRQNLLQGMKFIFLNPKQFKRMALAVELAGGLPVLMDEGSGNDDSALIEEGTVVMNSDPLDSTQGFSQQNVQWIKYVARYLKKHNKRMILDPELGYAVLYCDTRKYCNSDIEMAYSQALPRVPPPTLSQADILAQNTEHVPGSPIIRGRNEPDAINETHMENKRDTRSAAVTMTTKVKEEPISQKNAVEPDTRHIEEAESTPIGKKVKQEKTTPTKAMEAPLRRSPRRSPSPARLPSPARESSPVRQSQDKTKLGTNKLSVNKTRTGKVIVEDSDEEPTTSNKTNTRSTRTMKGNDDCMSKREDNLFESDDLFEVSSSSRKAAPKTKRKKVSESEEDEMPRSKRGRKNIVSLDSEEEKSEDKRRKKEKDSEKSGDERRKKDKEERGIEDSDNDDMFEVKPASSRRRDAEKRDRSEAADNGVGSNGSQKSPEKRTSQEQRSPIRVKREVRDQSHTLSEGTEPGFINTSDPSENVVKKELTNTKEEDQPSNCFVVKFVSLVARQPKPRAENSEETPEGYTRWKGKLVKNFKKFRKSSHAGAGSLPRIIGGSDLEPHIASRSKEIEDWFREEERALSQKSEMERQADELFEARQIESQRPDRIPGARQIESQGQTDRIPGARQNPRGQTDRIPGVRQIESQGQTDRIPGARQIESQGPNSHVESQGPDSHVETTENGD
ncbi:hypothetical protein FSP39_004849 [Pinctada imbricata]|uniref:Nibrin n=1 Tax=Pinctada imbricata TaxID=66713 RepID=A0AA88XF44_PINIB|nr:hypothetical protein FSP39_004849 [Pinctada imbricata]